MIGVVVISLVVADSVGAQTRVTSEADFQAAETAYASEDWAVAVQAFQTYIERYPDSDDVVRAYLRLGQTYGQMEQDPEARQAYSSAIRENADDPYASQAVSYWGNLYLRRYQYAESAQMCQEVMRTYPGTRASEMANYLLGTYLQSSRRAEDAITAYQVFLATYPSSVYRRSVFQQMVSLLVDLGRTEKAESLVTSNLDEAPDDVQLIRQLATVYGKQKRYGDAVRLLQSAVARRPNDLVLIEALGEAYVSSGDEARARATWMTMLSLGEDSYSTHQRLGALLKRHGFFDDAAAQFEAAIRLQPSLTYLYTQLGELHRIRGDVSSALNVYANALAAVGISFGDHQSILETIEGLYPPARREDALREALVAVRSRPGLGRQPGVLLAVAELHVMLGELAEGVRGFEELRGVYVDNGRLMDQYAQRLVAKRDRLGAVALYEGALRLYPQAPETPGRLLALGGQLEELGRAGEAADAYRRAIQRDPSRRLSLGADAALVRTLLHGLHEPEAALAHISEVGHLPQLSGSRPRLTLLSAEALIGLGRYDEADRALDNGSWTDPAAFGEAQFLRAETLLNRGEFDAAAEAYLALAKSDPTATIANDAVERVALVRANQGRNRAALVAYLSALRAETRGDRDASLAECLHAVDLAPDAPAAHLARMLAAEVASRAGDRDFAVKTYRSVADSEGTVAAEALLRLGQLFREANDPESAHRTYEDLLARFPQSAFAIEGRRALRDLMDDDGEGTD